MRHRLAGTSAIIGLSALTALAAFASDIVGGRAALTGDSVVDGSIDYPLDDGLWFLGDCGPTQWSIHLAGVNAAVDPAGTFDAAPISISGNGLPPCGFFTTTETGSMTLAVSSPGLVAGSGIECPTMTGSYTRSYTFFSIAVSGDCTVNGIPRPSKTLTLSLAGVPTQIGGDISSINGFSVDGTASW